jgi:hypothetical protein
MKRQIELSEGSPTPKMLDFLRLLPRKTEPSSTIIEETEGQSLKRILGSALVGLLKLHSEKLSGEEKKLPPVVHIYPPKTNRKVGVS